MDHLDHLPSGEPIGLPYGVPGVNLRGVGLDAYITDGLTSAQKVGLRVRLRVSECLVEKCERVIG